MFAEAIASVKRRYFGSGARTRPSGARTRPDADGARRTETARTDGDLPSFRSRPDEEILHLVEERGGRLNQGEIVDALEWSPATVSRRLGELEADGRVVRYPVGRRKLVCLPDCRPAAARSPFEA